jgi:diamine N-acetyltransferase
MTDIVYRGVTAQDTDALAALARNSFAGAFAHLYADEDLNIFLKASYAPHVIADEMANPLRLYRVAEQGGALIGYCKLKLETGFGGDLRADMAGRKIMDLSQLYMRSDATGKGIGDALMTWALDEAKARGYDDILLSVYSENYGAQRFYARYGFTKYADIYFMVGNHRDDEFLYRLQLTDCPGAQPAV